MDSFEIEIDANEIQNIIQDNQQDNVEFQQNNIVGSLFNYYVASLINEMDHDNLQQVLQDSFDNCNQLVKDSSKVLIKETIKYNNIDKELKKENKICSICFEKFYYNQNVNLLDCKHIFHTKCLSEWYKYKQECPVCRKNI